MLNKFSLPRGSTVVDQENKIFYLNIGCQLSPFVKPSGKGNNFPLSGGFYLAKIPAASNNTPSFKRGAIN